MSDQLPQDPPQSQRNGGLDVSGGQVQVGRDAAGRDIQTAGRDIAGGDIQTAGRDIVGRDVISVTTTQTGFTATAVQKLLVTMAVLLCAMFFCGFSGGIFVGGGILAIAKTNPQLPDRQDAQVMTELFATLDSKQANAPFEFTASRSQVDTAALLKTVQTAAAEPPTAFLGAFFGEKQMNSYVYYELAPQLGLSDTQVRFLPEAGHFAMAGKRTGTKFVATFWVTAGDNPLRLESVAVQVLDSGGSFGWVAIPLPSWVLQPLVNQANDLFKDSVKINSVTGTKNGWMVSGAKQ